MTYFKIPIGECDICINKQPLYKILKEHYHELYELENEKMAIQCSSDYTIRKRKKMFHECRHRHSLAFAKYGIPKYLLAIQEKDKFKELLTGVELTGIKVDSIFKYETTLDDFASFYVNTKYNEKIDNYINTITEPTSKKVLAKIK